MAVTNTNPEILTVEQAESINEDIQLVNLTLTPTGFGIGLATVTIRPLIVSTSCLFADGSFTLMIQIRKTNYRGLAVNYPYVVANFL